MRAAAELLPQIYRKLARDAAGEEAILVALWPVVVGPRLASRARPVRLFGATLIVDTASQQWRRELARMSLDIVDRLNLAAGKVVLKDIEFRVVVTTPPRPPERAASATGAAQDESGAIADPHLRRLYRLSRRRAPAK